MAVEWYMRRQIRRDQRKVSRRSGVKAGDGENDAKGAFAMINID
ncbi:hypothetical protein [Methanoculleus sp. UBA291]